MCCFELIFWVDAHCHLLGLQLVIIIIADLLRSCLVSKMSENGEKVLGEVFPKAQV